jgi:hypothetical protein
MKNIIFFIGLIVIPIFANSQDTLLLKTGSKILCTITSQDSSSVYFNVEKNDQIISSYIYKEKIQEIRYYNPNHTKIPTKQSLEISIGLSFPIGEYATTDSDNLKSGYAGKGFNINLVYGYKFTKNIGIAVKANYVNNNFNVKSYYNDISENVISYSKNFYVLYGALAGPAVNLNPLKKITFFGQFLCGIAQLTEPVISCNVNNNSEKFKISVDQKSAVDVVYNVRLGAKYKINDNVDITTNMDYMHGAFDFGNCELIYSNVYTGSVFHSEEFNRGTQNYDVLNISIGVNMKF